MRITLDLDKELIIVPDNYYVKVDAMNEVIKKSGGTHLDYIDYIKNAADAAIDKAKKGEQGMVRKSDVTSKRK